MKPSSRPTRRPSRLSNSVLHQVNPHTLTASAAGAGMLAQAHPGKAKIVFTPAHHVILRGRNSLRR